MCIKVVILLGLVLSINAQMGGKTRLDGEELLEAQGILVNSLDQLAIDGRRYELIRIIKATKQVVAGTKYEYEVDLRDDFGSQPCAVEIWSRPWMPVNGFQIDLDCPDYRVSKTHN